MNAFDVPEPPSFTVSIEQLRWAEAELQLATKSGKSKVLLLHCYPSDLKVGGAEVNRLVHDYHVRLIDMGHTHYNEIANDGRALYFATPSTGQIEEGPVGYSVINLDRNVVSWRFVELGKLPVAVITSPSDDRLLTRSGEASQKTLKIRAKFWGHAHPLEASADLDGQRHPMKRIDDSQVWEVLVPSPHEGTYPLKVSFQDAHGSWRATKFALRSENPRNGISRSGIRTMRSKRGRNMACWEPSWARTRMARSGNPFARDRTCRSTLDRRYQHCHLAHAAPRHPRCLVDLRRSIVAGRTSASATEAGWESRR